MESREVAHSLQADLATGWKPKLKIIGPMPLNYDNPSVDQSLMALLHQESAFYQVVYLGPRPKSSFKLHEQLAKGYRYKYQHLLHNEFAHLKPFFKKFYSLFEPVGRRPFSAMNPHLPVHEVLFDSAFESGNLDAAVRLKTNDYDLILRVDSNTAGHVLWYYFRVSNPEPSAKKVRLNLVNLRKDKSAYSRGMRPFIRRNGQQWEQIEGPVTLSSKPLPYHRQNLSTALQKDTQELKVFRRVSFEVELGAGEAVELAYCVPYTYSRLLQDLKDLRKKAEALPEVYFEVNLDHESLSGLEIPVLKIRSGSEGNGKFCVFVLCRQHPGESNSSHVLKGSLEQLLSSDPCARQVLRHCDFVVVPMLNPDGVVAGNFRTSLFGRDLNRLWKSKDATLIPEIEAVRTLFSQLVTTYKKKLLLFLDYHGHSTRKNAFLLGPGILDAHLLNDIRVLPRILADCCPIFRYPSCSFRLDQGKKTTARALFGKFAGLSYTLETSNWAYYQSGSKSSQLMNRSRFEQLGAALMEAVGEFVAGRAGNTNRHAQRAKESAQRKLNIFKSRKDLKFRKSETTREGSGRKLGFREVRTRTEVEIGEAAPETGDLQRIEEERPGSVHSSDGLSEGRLDSEGSSEDMEEGRFRKYIRDASEMLVEFERMYYGEDFRKGMSKYRLGSQSTQKLLFSQKKKKPQAIQACLRLPQSKPEGTFQTGQQPRPKKKIYLEDSFRDRLRDSLSRNHQREDLSRKREQLLLSAEQSYKSKLKLREAVGLTEGFSRGQHLGLLQLDHSQEYRRQQRSNEGPPRVRGAWKDKREDLPVIKTTKLVLQDLSPTLKILVPKTRDKFNELLLSEQLLNKSAVLNVLKLSRANREPRKE